MSNESEKLSRSLDELRRQHEFLDREIAAEVDRPGSDDLTLAELKRRKLRVRDEIARLTGQAPVRPPAPPAAREWTTRVTSGGRVVLPAEARAALGLGDGAAVRVRLEDGRITILPIDAVVRDIQERWRVYVPGERSLADELIADRRHESEHE